MLAAGVGARSGCGLRASVDVLRHACGMSLWCGGALAGARRKAVGDRRAAEQDEPAPQQRGVVGRRADDIAAAGEDDRLRWRAYRVDLVAAVDREVGNAGRPKNDYARIDR